jgi:hypothetical protein
MHAEVPKAGFNTFKEFSKEYAMIVVSVLTALALEHAAQAWHHHRAAQEAEESFNVEIRSNLATLQNARKANAVQLKKLEHLQESLRADIKAKLSEADIVSRFASEAKHDFNFLIQVPNSRHEAWDVAVANGAAGWIAPAKLRVYSDAYVTQRGMLESMKTSISTVLNGPEMVNVLDDLTNGQASPRELSHALTQMIAAYGISDVLIEGAESKLGKSFPAAEDK